MEKQNLIAIFRDEWARATLAICFGFLLTFSARGAEDNEILGSAEVRKAVEKRRGKTVLSMLAAAMKPGAWAELETEMPKGLWTSPLVDGGRNKGGTGGLHIAGWTDDAHWDNRVSLVESLIIHPGFRVPSIR